MDNDERERRDQPAPDAAPDDEPAGDPEPSTAEPPTDEPTSVFASEIESWPSEDVAPGVTDAGETGATAADAGQVVDSSAVEAWPTEPPVAGSGGPDVWPTTPPEVGGEPILEPEPEPEPQRGEPPPSEVEAYAAPAAAAAAASSPEPEVPAAPIAEVEAEPAPEPDAQVDADPAVAAGVATAAGGTAESTLCPRCGTENPPGLSFCRSCGQRLVAAGISTTVDRPGAPEGTMACPRCGTHNRAGVAFCQNCGANLRGTSAGYVPPAAAGAATASAAATTTRGGAVLGPVVLLIGIVGLVTAYLLPFLYGTGSLFERAFGPGGYGAAFWSDYPDGGLADQAYFGLAAAVPVLVVLLGVLAIAGFVRARPGPLQMIGLVIALLWSVGLAVLFIVVELFGSWDGDLVGLLRVLTPAGIILFLSSLIIIIGTLTRLGRS